MEAARELDRGSHMVKHWFLDHPEEGSLPNFQFRVIGKYKDCLTRQIKEAIRVQNRPNNLYSKGEWGGGTIPRLVVEKAEWEMGKEERRSGKRKVERRRRQEMGGIYGGERSIVKSSFNQPRGRHGSE